MTRHDLRGALADALARCPAALALWEAGSAAFGRADDRSDLDLGVLARTGRHAEVWSAVDRAFDGLGGLVLRWHEPAPLFPGLDKRIYRPRRASRWLQVDLGIFPESARELHVQSERHGRIVVLFDHTGRLAGVPPWDAAAHRQRLGEALHQNLMKWQAYHGWFRKELGRGRDVDAFLMHLHLTVTPLLAVLNLRHRPHRWDFGFRYVREELPADAVRTVERLCYVAGPAELEERFAEAERLLLATVEELARDGIVPIDGSGGVDFSPLT